MFLDHLLRDRTVFIFFCQPDHPDHLYLILHLHVQMTIHIAETKVEGLKKKKALGYFTWPFILLSGLIFCLGT